MDLITVSLSGSDQLIEEVSMSRLTAHALRFVYETSRLCFAFPVKMSPVEEPNKDVLVDKNPTEKESALEIFKNVKEISENVLKVVNNLIEKLKKEELEVLHGIDLLDVKNQLMVQYLLNLVQVVILKTTGKGLEGNPAIGRLIENRIVLERIRPIEQKLSYQIEKYIKIFINGRLEGNDPSRFRANPGDMLSRNSDEENSESEVGEAQESSTKKNPGVYVPPKLTSVEYEEETGVEKQKKLYERARKQALRSRVIQELKEEYLDTPVEIKATNSAQQKEDKYQKMKTEFEETYFTRLPITKEEKRKSKLNFSLGALGDDITSFEDTSVLHGGTSYLNKKKRKKVMKPKGKLKKRRHH